MTLATLKGRIQTKLITYPILGLVTLFFAWAYETPAFFEVFFIAMVIGLAWEAIWGVFVMHQQGWAAFLFGGIEFFYIYVTSFRLHVPLMFHQALLYYLVSWVLIQLFLIYVLPVWRVSWGDDGAEIW